jgi:hypothetical protein
MNLGSEVFSESVYRGGAEGAERWSLSLGLGAPGVFVVLASGHCERRLIEDGASVARGEVNCWCVV